MRTVVRGDEDQRVLELARLTECFDQPAHDLVEFEQGVLVGMPGRRLAEIFLVRIVVEVRAARAVVEQPRLVGRRLLLDEVDGVSAPLLVEFGEDGDRDLLDVGGLLALRRVHEAAVEGHVLDPLGPGVGVDDLREEMRVAPFRVHVGDGEEAVEVVVADILRLRSDVLADVPLADRLRRVAGLAEQHGQGDFALHAAEARHTSAGDAGRAGWARGRYAAWRGTASRTVRNSRR